MKFSLFALFSAFLAGSTYAADYGLTPNRVRLAVLATPKEGLTTEEFHDYWLNHHASLFSSIGVVKRNLLKYEQVSALNSP